MRQLKELLRLKYVARLTHRQIAGVLNFSTGVISKYVRLAEAADLRYPLPDDIDDARLHAACRISTVPLRALNPSRIICLSCWHQPQTSRPR